MSTYHIPEATGASIRPKDLRKETLYPITAFGAREGAYPSHNTLAVNRAIQTAADNGGGTVVIPRGTYLCYTIHLQSNVNLCLEEGAVVAAARTDILHSYQKQSGEGGNYEEPERNLYVGLQDHGHTYFANSLVYGADLENIMIYGKGLFTGGRFGEDGILDYVLLGGDPAEPASREDKGHGGEWFGNKGIALVRCKNVVLADFSVTIGGHFAIIAEGCDNLYAEHLLVDTTRDAFDIDCCRNVTVRHTVCNSLTDDALCLKASFGAGLFQPLENVLIEDCRVCGYDAGSVYAGEYTRDKLIALDRCGPTGRVKFGTESTCGYHRVTIRRVDFDRSRGFCLEAVDCSSLTDVIFEDCRFDNVSSSPIFLRAGDRGRFPVTGSGASGAYPAPEGDVRLDNRGWILPNDRAYHCYPARRYTPHYNRNRTVTADGHSFFEVLDGAAPVTCNPANYEERDGKFYLKTWHTDLIQGMERPDGQPAMGDLYLWHNTAPESPDGMAPGLLGGFQAGTAPGLRGGFQADTDRPPVNDGAAIHAMRRESTGSENAHGSYRADASRELAEADLPLYANAVGCEKLASVSDILIRNITVTNADPRYPILLMGMTDSHIKNVILENISVEFRGGLTMEHAVEQRQLNTEWKYSQFHAREHVQSLPWLVNAFFLKHEGLLPRADWDAVRGCWQEDPYNVPELPDVYPESSNWGILPAYGLFAKHVDGLTLRKIRFSCKVPDGRHVCVFDDVDGVAIDGMEAYCREGLAPIAAVTDHYRRHTNAEYVPEQPYFTTDVTGVDILKPLLLHRTCDAYVINGAAVSGAEEPYPGCKACTRTSPKYGSGTAADAGDCGDDGRTAFSTDTRTVSAPHGYESIADGAENCGDDGRAAFSTDTCTVLAPHGYESIADGAENCGDDGRAAFSTDTFTASARHGYKSAALEADDREDSLPHKTSSSISQLSPKSDSILRVEIHAPAPGTPGDSLYPYPTVPCTDSGYRYAVDTDDYPLPLTVHRPFLRPLPPVRLAPGETCSLVLTVRNPASDVSEEADNGVIYNEQVTRLNYGVKGMAVPLTLTCENLPEGAAFDADSRRFSWTPAVGQEGDYSIIFVVYDGVLPEKMTVRVRVCGN